MADEYDNLLQRSAQIKNEVSPAQNTADRVGGVLVDIVNALRTLNENAGSAGIDDDVVDADTTWSSQKLNGPYNWVMQQMQGELYEQAMAKFVVTTTATGDSYISDVSASTTMTVTVTVKFDGSSVDADTTPTGWTRTALGTYTKSITGASGSIDASEFAYTPESGDYAGITVAKNSEAKAIAVTNPIYFGFVTTNDHTQLASVIESLTRQTARKQQTANLTNSNNAPAYYWILTKSTATATQLGATILNAPVSGKSFTSTQNPAITMQGYNLYISTNSCAPNGSFDDVALTINV